MDIVDIDSLNFRGGNSAELGRGFNFFLFSPLLGEDFQFDSYFSDGLKPPTNEFFLDCTRMEMSWL